MGKLNPKQVENLTEPGTYEDGDGLRLVVKPTGRKPWLLRFQLAGRRREMGLGSFPEVSLKKARLEASAKRGQLSDGVDPLAARDIERAAQREALRASEAKQLKFEKRTGAPGQISGVKAGFESWSCMRLTTSANCQPRRLVLPRFSRCCNQSGPLRPEPPTRYVDRLNRFSMLQRHATCEKVKTLLAGVGIESPRVL